MICPASVSCEEVPVGLRRSVSKQPGGPEPPMPERERWCEPGLARPPRGAWLHHMCTVAPRVWRHLAPLGLDQTEGENAVASAVDSGTLLDGVVKIRPRHISSVEPSPQVTKCGGTLRRTGSSSWSCGL